MTPRLYTHTYLSVVFIPCLLLGFFYAYKGILLDTDSKTYLFAAQEFVFKGRLLLPNGAPLVVFPPLFPLLLSLLQAVFETTLVPFMVINILFMGIGNYFAFKIVYTVASIEKYRANLLVLYTCSATIFLCFVYLYSESMFYPISMFYFYLKLKKEKQLFFVKAVLLTLMYLTRYTGLIFFVSFFLWDMYHAQENFKKHLGPLIKEYLLPFIMVMLWSIYCYVMVGNVTGDHVQRLDISVGSALFEELTLVGNWLLPCYAGLLLICMLLIYILVIKRVVENSKLIKTGYLVLFYLFTLFALRLVPRAAIEERTLFPIYFLFTLTVVGTIEKVWPKYANYLIGFICCYSLFRFAKNYLFWLELY